MSEKEVEGDPIKLHKDGYALYESSEYKKAKKKLLQSSELYQKANNFYDSATMLYKAGECEYMLENYPEAVEHFLDSADLCFDKGFDRFGVSGLEYVRDCYKALEDTEKVEEMERKIKKVKEKLKESYL